MGISPPAGRRGRPPSPTANAKRGGRNCGDEARATSASLFEIIHSHLHLWVLARDNRQTCFVFFVACFSSCSVLGKDKYKLHLELPIDRVKVDVLRCTAGPLLDNAYKLKWDKCQLALILNTNASP